MQRYRVTVGGSACDIQGFTNRHIQCAVDHVALLGGGEVELAAGTFAMADSLHLRSHVRVIGQGERTILRKNAMKSSEVSAFLGYGHYDLAVSDPDLFEPGEGVHILDDNAMGFYTSVATLVRREGNLWYVNRPHPHDYLHISHGKVYTLFPVVSAYDAQDAVLESVQIDGNAAENPVFLNGCRGGGVFAMRCDGLKLLNLTVRNANTEGISFQTCNQPEVGYCLIEDNQGNGLHPGSGSVGFHIHDCTSRRNKVCGLFYCLRVKHSLLEDCLFEDNGDHGVSTGARDTDSLNRRLTIRRNGGSGFFFRDDAEINAAHRTVIEACTITTNCRAPHAEAEVHIQGGVDGVRLRDTTITRASGKPALLLGPAVTDFQQSNVTCTPAGDDAVVDLRAVAV